MIEGLHHTQLACPVGSEDALRAFYVGVLGMVEIAKPPVLAARGGAWFRSGTAELHLGVEEPFAPARKAHPAFLVASLESVRAELAAAGVECVDSSGEIPGVQRFHAFDPFGNRLEFQQAS